MGTTSSRQTNSFTLVNIHKDWLVVHAFNGDDGAELFASSQDDRFEVCESKTFTCTNKSGSDTCKVRAFHDRGVDIWRSDVKNGKIYAIYSDTSAGDGILEVDERYIAMSKCGSNRRRTREINSNNGDESSFEKDNIAQEHAFVEHVFGGAETLLVEEENEIGGSNVAVTNLRGGGAAAAAAASSIMTESELN